MKIIISIGFFAVIAYQAAAQDYCNPKLCPVGEHIGCNNGNFGPQCPPNARLVNITPKKPLILQLINKFRNDVAIGNLKGFKTATRMGTVTWSQDLARLAAFNAKRCEATKDECRNTYTFKNVDQRWFQQYSKASINYDEYINRMTQQWYYQHKNSNASKIEAFEEADPPYNAFAIMMNERLTHVGCATAEFNRSGLLYFITFCNFSTNNIEGSSVYEAGDIASKCKTGANPKYPGLCSTAEEIDPNPV